MVISKAATKHIWDFISSTTFLIMNMTIPFSNLFSNHIQKYWSCLLGYSCNKAALRDVWSLCMKPGTCPHVPSLLRVCCTTIVSRSHARLDFWHNCVPGHPWAELCWWPSAQSCLGPNSQRSATASYEWGKHLQGKRSFVLLFPSPKSIFILWHSVHFSSLLKSLCSYVLFLMNALIGLVYPVNTTVVLCRSASAQASSPPLSWWHLFVCYLISFMFSLHSAWYFYHASSYIFSELWCAQ